MMKTATIRIKSRTICPLCGQLYRGRPVVSRADSVTRICPDCGTREALTSLGVCATEQDQILEILHRYQK